MIKKLKISFNDASLTVAIDTKKVTTEMAHEVNAFFSGSNSRLQRVGCPYKCCVALMAKFLLILLIDDESKESAVEQLSDLEGYGYFTNDTLKIIDFDVPDLNYWEASIEEVEQ